MSTPQHPIPSGYGARTTAAEVVAGLDLGDKTAIVTGGYSGVGLETTRALAGAGAHVIVPARRPDQARAELADMPGNVSVDELDLADQESVRGFVSRFLGAGEPVDILVNNAGVMANPETRVGPGWESQFATNHLGHYALTGLLWEALTAEGGARVVALTSTGHKISPIRFDDVMFEQSPYDKWVAYGQSKTADSLFAVHLDAVGQASGVRVFAVHPGGIMTPLQRHLPREEMIQAGWMAEDGTVDDRFKSPEQGAATTVWAATSPQLAGMGGVYCEDVDVAAPTETGSSTARFRGVDPHAVDPEAAARLWALSAELTGIDPSPEAVLFTPWATLNGMARARRVAVTEPTVNGRYAAAFGVARPSGDTRSAEQWARAMFEGAPRALRWSLVLGWRAVLGLRLAPRPSAGHVLGWRIVGSSSERLSLEARSALMAADKVVLVEPDRVTVTTGVRFARPVARVLWAVVAPVHHRTEPLLLTLAARRAG